MDALRIGETCWRAAPGGRVKLFIDCQDYFLAVRDALLRARRSVALLGWSFDPRSRLAPGREDDMTIGQALIDLVSADRDLDVRLLVWRSALPISATQAFFPHRAKSWFAGAGVRFELDADVPLGACHHQKILVIDDALAFVGGADFASDRWDTSAHLDKDPRRRTPSGFACPPRHEVMAMADGPIAAQFGLLFRERWRRAVGEIGEPPDDAAKDDLWPADTPPDLETAPLAISRTSPAWRERPGVTEIADLTLEAIGRAQRLIYLENQYFTWPLAVEALAARLAEPEGPHVVLIGPERSPSYFDRITMDRARSNALWRLKSSDVFGRFHAFAPHTRGGRPIISHSKVMIVDDRLLRVSSANLNNRSQGFDTECELAIEADRAEDKAAVGLLRDRLAGHWLGRSAEEVAEMRRLAGSLPQALWTLDTERRLRPLQSRRLGMVGEFIADFHIGDPIDVAESWRPIRRRRRLLADVRELRRRLSAAQG
jgi:phosphatidylserine/phosphatidylglycerophosphate/cardiolipin synthase-like enzyme